jgi:hypothetical protein
MKQGWGSFAVLWNLGNSRRRSVAHGQNHTQFVEVYQSLYLAAAFGLNYPEFPDCCLRTET